VWLHVPVLSKIVPDRPSDPIVHRCCAGTGSWERSGKAFWGPWKERPRVPALSHHHGKRPLAAPTSMHGALHGVLMSGIWAGVWPQSQFFSFFKNLVGKEIAVELKNDVALTGKLHSVDQYLNIKLEDVEVVHKERFPQLVREPRPQGDAAIKIMASGVPPGWR
jgi:small nuclear ribonucleoprotein (snRNP)-like protein